MFKSLSTLASIAYFIAFSQSQEQSSTSTCVSYSQPNPIFSDYPGNVTGTINTTIAILPIPLSVARSIVPKEYDILTHAYRDLLPLLPQDMYPALLHKVYDHDIRYQDYQLGDFSRAAIEFPFVDLLHDNMSTFRWSPRMWVTSTAEIPMNGAREYGTEVYPSTFDPSCNSYEYTNSSSAHPPGSTYFKAQSVDGAHALDAVFRPNLDMDMSTFPISFFINATNQPTFADGKHCDNFIVLFNSTLSKGQYAPSPVIGEIKATMDLFDEEMVWKDAVGLQVDLAFIENHLVGCDSLKGYESDFRNVEIMSSLDRKPRGSTNNSSYTPMYTLQNLFSNYFNTPTDRSVR